MQNTKYWKEVGLGLHIEANNENLTHHILGLISSP
jgi:hypothetical protein